MRIDGLPEGSADGEPAGDDARSVSSPEDVGGRGPVTLADRTRQGGQGSPDTNQAKAEPMPAPPGDPDPAAPLEPPSLAEMNVAGADPQSPSHPATQPRVASPDADPTPAQPGDAQGVPVPHEAPAPGTSQESSIHGATAALPPDA